MQNLTNINSIKSKMIYTINEQEDFKRTDKLFEQFSSTVTPSKHTNVEYSKRNGNTVFGIVKEHGQYIIKSAKKKGTLFAEDFDYLEGYENRKMHQRKTLQEAIKYLHLIINEDKYVMDVPVATPPAPEPAPTNNPMPTDSTPDAPVEVDGSQDAGLDAGAEGDQPAQSDDEKEIQKITGTLAQDLRQQIDDDNEKFTVGMFKSIIAAAKNLSPEAKGDVMQKAEEVLNSEDEGQPADQQQPAQNQQQVAQTANPNPPVQESVNEDMSTLKTKLATKNEKISDVDKGKKLQEILHDLSLNVEQLYAKTHGVYTEEGIMKLTIMSDFHKTGEIIIKAYVDRLGQSNKRFFKGYYKTDDGDYESSVDLQEDQLLQYVGKMLDNYGFEDDFNSHNEKNEKVKGANAKSAIDKIKETFLPNPNIIDTKEIIQKNIGALRLITKAGMPEAFIFFSGLDPEPYDMYVVKKGQLAQFIAAEISGVHKYEHYEKEKNGQVVPAFRIVDKLYDYGYFDLTETGGATKPGVLQRVSEFLKDLNKGNVAESVIMTKKELFESLDIKKKVNERFGDDDGQPEPMNSACRHFDKINWKSVYETILHNVNILAKPERGIVPLNKGDFEDEFLLNSCEFNLLENEYNVMEFEHDAYPVFWDSSKPSYEEFIKPMQKTWDKYLDGEIQPYRDTSAESEKRYFGGHG